MDLMKNYYEYGNNLNEIHVFLQQNENRIDKIILKKIRESIIEPKPRFECNIDCKIVCIRLDTLRCSCCFILFFLVFILIFGGFAYMFISRKK